MPYGGTDLQITARQKSFLITLREEEEEEGEEVEEEGEEESIAFIAGETGHITPMRINHKAIVCS